MFLEELLRSLHRFDTEYLKESLGFQEVDKEIEDVRVKIEGEAKESFEHLLY